jgi:hypothetical protein
MKNIFYICLSLFVLGCSNQVGFENYRNNPFQFPFPEYYLKADIESVPSNDLQSEHLKIDIFNTTFSINKNFADEVIKKNNFFVIKKSCEKVFIVMSDNEKFMGCNDEVRELEKDFCSAFSTTKDYLEKVFMLTPDDLSKEKYLAVGNRWIVHNKGHLFQEVEKIKIYKSTNFEAFRTDFKPSNNQVKVDLRIFQNKDPKKFLIFAFVNRNEPLIKQILTTLQ